jgi:hypothetical protein
MKKIIFTAILFCIAAQLKLQAQAMIEVHSSLRYLYAGRRAVKLQQPARAENAKTYTGRYFATPLLTKYTSPMDSSGMAEVYTQTPSIKSVKQEVFSRSGEPVKTPAEKVISKKQLAGIFIRKEPLTSL